jgi:uncharacterized damage-inducible protein DinB
MSTQLDPWLRGALAGIPTLLQPAAHALVLAQEDVEQALAGLSEDDFWKQPGGITPLGFHVVHMAGATDRLMTYARGEQLSDAQKAAAGAENGLTTTRPAIAAAVGMWRSAYDRALAQLRATSEAELAKPIAIGRAQLPSTVIGAIFHAAEHAGRHAGQVVTTSKVIRGLASGV